MSHVLRCDLCKKDIHPVSESDSIFGPENYGDRYTECQPKHLVKAGWGRGIFSVRQNRDKPAPNVAPRVIDAHPECVEKLFDTGAAR